jgi:hypothetical protein
VSRRTLAPPAGDDVRFTTEDRPFAIFGWADRLAEGKMSVADILSESEKHINQTLDEARARAGA